MTQTTTEAVARIIRGWDLPPSGQRIGPGTRRAIDEANTKAAKIAALITPGEEFLEFKEALDDVRGLRAEYECLNGGGPGWSARNKAAWAKVDELFANEDEAAYDRHQEGLYG